MRLIKIFISIIAFKIINTNTLFCQENKIVRYIADNIYTVILNDDEKVAYYKEEGMFVMIFIDNSTKKYKILFQDIRGKNKLIDFDFVMFDKNGSLKMTDKNNYVVHIFDSLAIKGELNNSN